jgi:hypothetical protein
MAKGGKRKGAGRPSQGEYPANIRKGVALTAPDFDFLLQMGGGNLSKGVREAVTILRSKNQGSNESDKQKYAPNQKFMVSQDLVDFVLEHANIPSGHGDNRWRISSFLAFMVFSSRKSPAKRYWPGKPSCLTYETIKNLHKRTTFEPKINDLASALRPRTSEHVYLEVEALRERFANDAILIGELLDDAHKVGFESWVRKNQERDEINKID